MSQIDELIKQYSSQLTSTSTTTNPQSNDNKPQNCATKEDIYNLLVVIKEQQKIEDAFIPSMWRNCKSYLSTIIY